jgi:hypothetical protein
MKMNWKISTLALAFGLMAPTLHAETSKASGGQGFESVANMETLRSSDLEFDLIVREDRRTPRHRDRAPIRNPGWECTAQDNRGLAYSATNSDRFSAREQALNRCERRSFRCYDAGCRPIR